MMLPELFVTYPALYAVNGKYIVTVAVKEACTMWVRVGDKNYYDASNGILRSKSLTHKMEIPMDALDAAREYTVCFRRIIERKPYFSDLGEIEEYSSVFRPVEGDKIDVYHIADAHNRSVSTVEAGTWFGDDLDLLVLNGDLPDHSGNIENFATIHKIAGGVTRGELPTIFSRGNHDLRGICAEELSDHTPTDNGCSYYTVRVGSVWALVLDCAEDKDDESKEYGHTICCHDFRVRETEFLERIANDPENEYNAPGVKHRIVIVHNPFPETLPAPFDIEKEIYTRWCRILAETVKPELMLCGHVHECRLTMPGDALDHKGTPCPIVCASDLDYNDESYYRGGALTFEDDKITVRFTDQTHSVTNEFTLPLKK